MDVLSGFIPFFIFFGIFLIIMKTEHRNLTCGVFFALSAYALFAGLQGVTALLEENVSDGNFFSVIIHLFIRLIQILIAAGPILLALFPIAMGIMLIRREGIRLRSIASIFFGALTLVYIVVWPMIGGLSNRAAFLIYGAVDIMLIYFITLKAMFTASSVINLLHTRGDKGYRYILVLGTDLEEMKIENLMQTKVTKSLQVYRENPGSKLIFTGSDEWNGKTEAQIMAEKAREEGVPDEDIIIEEKSSGAEENIKAAYALMEHTDNKKGPKFALVTGAHHAFRALILARLNKIKCDGYGAPVKIYYRMNAFAIEYLTYLKRTKKRHIFGIALLLDVWLGMFFFLVHLGFI